MSVRLKCLVALVLLLCGCSSQAEPRVDEGSPGGERPGSEEASASEEDVVPGELSQRVVEAVLPVSGESMPSVRWLKEEMAAASLPRISACLEERGRLDLMEVVETIRTFERGSGQDPFFHPEPDLLLETGLGGGTIGLPADIGDGMISGDESSDGGIAMACMNEAGADEAQMRIVEMRVALAPGWTRVVEEVSYDDRMMGHYEDFALCLRAEGVPDEAASGNPVEFIQWVEGQRMPLGQAEATALGLEQARLYVECGEGMFAARAELLRPEREVYVEEHRDQLQELTELVADLGVG